MSTNYYWHEKPNKCVMCGHDDSNKIHLGKSSLDWVFFLHTDSEEGLHTLKDWQEKWTEPGSVIFSEYGTRISPCQMLDIITNREGVNPRLGKSGMMAVKACLGPNGLYRGTDNRHFAPSNREDTYDLVEGEFC